MSGETIDEGANAEQQLLARSLGALIGLRRFDSPVHQGRAVHGATLALSPYADDMAPSDAKRLKELRDASIRARGAASSRNAGAISRPAGARQGGLKAFTEIRQSCE